MRILICVIAIVFELETCNCRNCGWGNRTICCNGYVWNAGLNLCIPCKIGYRGPNCDHRCHYPSYGSNCQMKCMCSENYCHYVYGCYKTNGGNFSSVLETDGLNNIDIIRKTTLGNNGKTVKNVEPLNHSLTKVTDMASDSRKCKDDSNPRKSSGTIKTTIVCFIVVAGVFILLYIGSHFVGTKQQPKYLFRH